MKDYSLLQRNIYNMSPMQISAKVLPVDCEIISERFQLIAKFSFDNFINLGSFCVYKKISTVREYYEFITEEKER